MQESDFDEEVIDTNWESDFIQSQSRNGNRFRPNSLQGQQRFFFGAFNPLNSNGFTPFWRTGSTVVTVTVSTTLTTAVISSCVPATQLAAGAANIPCARKRRNVVESFDDSFLDVSPSLVQRFVVFTTFWYFIFFFVQVFELLTVWNRLKFQENAVKSTINKQSRLLKMKNFLVEIMVAISVDKIGLCSRRLQ